jgi:MFS family permease
VFTIGNLLCGFSRTLGQLIIFRVIAGLGGGGINVLVLIIISDISSLKERGKVRGCNVASDWQFQGLVGMGVALGGALGPLLGGIFTEKATVSLSFELSNIAVAMGILGLCSCERPFGNSNHHLFAVETGNRFPEIET